MTRQQTVRRWTALALMSGVFATFAATQAKAQRFGRPDTPQTGACFYRDANFQGDYFCVRSGDAIDSLPNGMNDQISSIRTFGRGVEVTVFQNRRFEGRAQRFEDVRNLKNEGWNDRLSSLRVQDFSRGGGFGRDRDRDRDRDRGDRGDRGRDFGNGNGNGNGNQGNRNGNADVIVRRAYQDVLNREPDQDGLRIYRSHIIDDNWSEDQVRNDLRRSSEFRNRSQEITRDRATQIVRQAYLSVLNREPDGGSQPYVDRVMREKWSQQDVERELRNSPEYRSKVRQDTAR